ncbi:MAG TPA: hypothetical protein VJB87_03355 [Candidatus Nanoarchaeia archaeon]|nr:hypothetical protein [Candidatus Nanoarchaeia archaeon]
MDLFLRERGSSLPNGTRPLFVQSSGITASLSPDTPFTLNPITGKPEEVYFCRDPLEPFTVADLRQKGLQNMLARLGEENYEISWLAFHEPEPQPRHPRFSEYSRVVLMRTNVGDSSLHSVVYRRKNAKQFTTDITKLLRTLGKKYSFVER